MEKQNSLNQYLEIYKAHSETFKDEKWPGFNILKDRAFEQLSQSMLPDLHTEGYEKTSLEKIFMPDLGLNIHQLDLIKIPSSFSCGSDLVGVIKIVVHNDVIAKIELPRGKDSLPSGLRIVSFTNNMSPHDKKFVENHFASLFSRENNAAELLNIMTGMSGILIEVLPGHVIDVPVQIVNYTGGQHPMLCNRRLIVKLNTSSSLHLLKCDHSVDMVGKEHSNNDIVILDVDEHATLRYVDMEETNQVNNRVANYYVRTCSHSNTEFDMVTLMNGVTRNNIYVECKGVHSEIKMNGLAIGHASSHIDNFTDISHQGDRQHSEQWYKYSLYDKARGVFAGKITVEPNSRFNEAHQNNRNIIVSPQARMYSKPQLLIYNDDVKCSHGATTGQLDTRAVYYMESRGIPRHEAEAMLMQAFMNDVIDRMNFPGVKERLFHLVEKRLRGEEVMCGACKIHKDA